MPCDESMKTQEELKKDNERREAEFVALLLSENWELTDSESPDFIVHSDSGIFGLEVVDCFSGSFSKKSGAKKVKDEAYRREILVKIREECVKKFPASQEWKLDYISSEFEDSDIETDIKSAFDSLDWNNITPTLYIPIKRTEGKVSPLEVTDSGISGGFPDCIMINTTGNFFPGPHWRVTGDWISEGDVSSEAFQRSINEKLKKISRYKQKAEDIRLLVTSSVLLNSRDVRLPEGFIPQIGDFNKVYVSYFPYYVKEFPSGRVFKALEQSSKQVP